MDGVLAQNAQIAVFVYFRIHVVPLHPSVSAPQASAAIEPLLPWQETHRKNRPLLSLSGRFFKNRLR